MPTPDAVLDKGLANAPTMAQAERARMRLELVKIALPMAAPFITEVVHDSNWIEAHARAAVALADAILAEMDKTQP